MLLKLVDISKWQGQVNWKALKEAPLNGVYLRASQGLVADPYFHVNLAGARSVGMRPGAYHFFRPEVDPDKQAQFLFDQHPPLMRNDLPPAIDVEFSKHDGMDEWLSVTGPAAREAAILEFLQKVESLFKVKPVIYTSAAFVNQYLSPFHQLGVAYKLWVAYYPQTHVLPLDALPVWDRHYLPHGWTDFWMWQYGQVKIPGVGVVDGNLMQG